MSYKVSVTESVTIAGRSPEEVWDFTQDYARRSSWDDSILAAEVLPGAQPLRVRVRARGGLTATFQYRQFDRPTQTSVAMQETSSWLIEGGGGSWSYARCAGGTTWTQTNTLLIKPGWWRRLLVPSVRWQLASSTAKAIAKARSILETR
jgi:hypothetical protein